MADVLLSKPIVNVKYEELDANRRRRQVDPVVRVTAFTERGNGRTFELNEEQAINLATNILLAARDAKAIRMARERA